MYSRKAWGGGTEPHILVKYLAYESSGEDDPHPDPVVASIIFEWKDHDLIGIPLPQDDGQVGDLASEILSKLTRVLESYHMQPGRDRC